MLCISYTAIQIYVGEDADHYEPRHEISINVVRATSKGSDLDQPAHIRSMIRAFASRFNIL